MSGHKAVQGSGAARRWELLAGLLAGAIILIAGLGYSRAVYALYFTPRVVAIYPLAILLVAVWLVKDRLGVRRLSLDPLDGLAVLFSLWQIVVTIISPSSNLAWYGVLNRGGGALLWVTAALLFMVARRALASREALIPFALCCAALLALAGLASVLQLAGAEPPWGGVGTYLEQGRMTGTAGNPVNLAGLALLTIWTGGLVLMRQDLGRAVGVALGVASLPLENLPGWSGGDGGVVAYISLDAKDAAQVQEFLLATSPETLDPSMGWLCEAEIVVERFPPIRLILPEGTEKNEAS